MRFKAYQYARPDMDRFSSEFNTLLEKLVSASSSDEQLEIFDRLNHLRNEFYSMLNLCYIRHTINTEDKFYEKEQSFFDQETPNFEALNNRLYKIILESPFRDVLEAKLGKQLFVIAEQNLKTFHPSILEDLKEENTYSSQYVKLKAQAKISFEGKEYNLSSIRALETAKDRDMRRRATQARWKFFEEKAPEIEDIFDKLVKVRHRIAVKLGYENFIELGYARMFRSDYNAQMVANFRDQVKKFIVPLASALYERQANRLQLDELSIYDEDFRFPTGNPEPKGGAAWIISQAEKMYQELSPETHHFIQYMRGNDLMDLESKAGKATGGYCTYISKYKSPFIFSNFNGTSSDIDVLTHEAGHAFQVYSSRDLGISEYNWPTYEACEIHSMSMEFFTWPWMHLFFNGDTEKYKFAHLANAIQFIPYGAAIDEFQHFVYENPMISCEARNKAWRDIEKIYLPHRSYANLTFLEQGGFWQKQSHLFFSPFYYIDYALAQICAFQFWKMDQEDHEQAWSKYLLLCQKGGSESFLDLLQAVNLRSPFDDGCIESVIGSITSWLNEIDDTRF